MILGYFILGCISCVSAATVHFQPEQIHLAFGHSVYEIVVTWSTITSTNSSIVEYGLGGSLNSTVTGSAYAFEDGGKERRVQYIHRVALSDLLPGQIYYYRCGSEQGWSGVYYFRTLSNSANATPTFAIYGDLGNINGRSLPHLQHEAQMGRYDAVIHVGDFAYDMHSDNGRVRDEFMKQIEPIAAYVPYMTCPGNHEKAYNFSHYRTRFSMPGLPGRMFYSFDIGPVHFISFDTEVYYTVNDDLKNGMKQLISQYKWLEKDLQEANKPENRERRPWIITYGHKPMYCSTLDVKADCGQEDNMVRGGLPVIRIWGLEKLFYDYGVDLEFWGHEHSYERSWPVYNGTVYNGSAYEPYTNPNAPVHIITGAAGAEYHVSGFSPNPRVWSALRSIDYGYTRLRVHNSSHLQFEQISIDQGGQVVDNVWLIKDTHGRYNSTSPYST